MGWVEEIGTGIYNVNRYLPFYAPVGKASFKEDVIFTTIIPIPNPEELRKPEVKKTIPHDIHHDTPEVTPEVTPQVIKFLQALEGEMSREELLSKLDLKDRVNLREIYLKPALKLSFIELTLPGKLKSKKQKYRITEKGKIFLRSRIENHEG
jgi:hypothetical protein